MELLLKDLNWKVCLIYLDDIIVYDAGFYPALDWLKMVWKRIREANLKLKPTKCCLMRAQVSFLGHIVSREGVGPRQNPWRNGQRQLTSPSAPTTLHPQHRCQ